MVLKQTLQEENMKRIGGLLVGALDGFAIAYIYAEVAEITLNPTVWAIIGGIIGLIFPMLAFIICIPIAIFIIKAYIDHDPRKNPRNRINM